MRPNKEPLDVTFGADVERFKDGMVLTAKHMNALVDRINAVAAKPAPEPAHGVLATAATIGLLCAESSRKVSRRSLLGLFRRAR